LEAQKLNSTDNSHKKYFDEIIELKNSLNIIETEKSELRK
jgi:hypothetical protein